MNVRELKELLETLDPNLPVVVIDAGKGWELSAEEVTKSFLCYIQIINGDGNNRKEAWNHAIVLGG